MARFWLGTHNAHWLGKTDVPLFISRDRLAARKTLPLARGLWALDSHGFGVLALHGTYDAPPPHGVTVRGYIREVCLMLDRPGNLQWAACMDWMCETPILAATAIVEGEYGADWRERYEAVKPAARLKWLIGLLESGELKMSEDMRAARVRLHQRRTLENYLQLTDWCREFPWLPVLQGFTREEYLRHAEDYAAAGVDLASLPLVGLGSVCRRQDTSLAESLIREFEGRGIRTHGFGFKVRGLARVADVVTSADSMAWSYRGRSAWLHEERRLCGGEHKGGCNNCLPWALKWRGRITGILTRPTQAALW